MSLKSCISFQKSTYRHCNLYRLFDLRFPFKSFILYAIVLQFNTTRNVIEGYTHLSEFTQLTSLAISDIRLNDLSEVLKYFPQFRYLNVSIVDDDEEDKKSYIHQEESKMFAHVHQNLRVLELSALIINPREE